jgi:protein-disulfide isomerase
MTDTAAPSPRPWTLFAAGAALLAVGVGAGWFYESRRTGGSAGSSKGEIEAVVREYILANPEILPEAMERLRNKERQAQLGKVGDALEQPFPGMILGNPDGAITLVEFSDYACGYCRRSVSDVEALVAANPDLKVVIREMPILSPASADAAKMAMAAAQQGKFAAFHKAMFAAGQVNPTAIAAAARVAGLDLARAQAVLAAPGSQAELARNVEMARELGFDGTPSWVIGDQAFSGAVGRDQLAKAIADARGS